MSDLPGLPSAAGMRWLRAALRDTELPDSWHAELISGGLSNITYRLRWGAHRYILRRPPLGPTLPRAHDMNREYRVLTALHTTAVPVPEPLAFCPDPDVIGAPFYLMREVPGTVLRSHTESARLTSGQRRTLAEHLIDVLADLHAIDPEQVGLADYGRWGGYAQRQLRTWGQQWQRSRTRDLPEMETLLAALAAGIPPEQETTIVHGDFRIDNTIVADGPHPSIAAVLDWELSTLGDPLADLGLLLTYWHDPGDHQRAKIRVAAGITALDGFPTGAELADRYAQRTGRDLAYLPFYLALGALKLAVILEGVHARYLAGQTHGQGYQHAGDAVPVLAARGIQLLRPTNSSAR
jgi:aminoglycoside phosphotransferase (APT) family kinase protein